MFLDMMVTVSVPSLSMCPVVGCVGAASALVVSVLVLAAVCCGWSFCPGALPAHPAGLHSPWPWVRFDTYLGQDVPRVA